MSGLKALKARIKTAKSSQKITKAMKMVSASKLRRARMRFESSLPYLENIRNVYDKVGGDSLLESPVSNKVLLIVTSSDRGLCGGFNANLVKLARRQIVGFEAANVSYDIITIGKKAYDSLKAIYKDRIIERYDNIVSKEVVYNELEKKVLDKLVLHVMSGNYSKTHCIFSKFKSVVSQENTVFQLYPYQSSNQEVEQETFVEFEDSKNAILASLEPMRIKAEIYQALLENIASEQASRVTAMDNATRNAGEMIKKLTLKYNRTRQAVITKELIEIISGAEAV